MKLDDLRGRELAAWLYGYAADAALSKGKHTERYLIARAASAEIERLCAAYARKEINSIDAPVRTSQAARDAAALDEIAAMFHVDRHGSVAWKPNLPPSGTYATEIVSILERTGRKVGGK